MGAATHFAVNPQTGERLALIGGEWVPATNLSTGNVGGAPKLTEDQGKAQGWGKLQRQAETSYQHATDAGYDPGTVRNRVANAVEGLPFHGGEGIADWIRDDVSDGGRQAELQWTDAQLRAASGANAPEPETRRNSRTYFPGSDTGPATREQMSQGRRTAFDAVRTRAGPAAESIGEYVKGGKPRTPDWWAGRPPAQIDAARRYSGAVGTPGTAKNPFVIEPTEFDALPPKAYFIGPDGALRRKP